MIRINVNSPFSKKISVYSHELNKVKPVTVQFLDSDTPINLSSYTITATFVCNGFLVAENVNVEKDQSLYSTGVAIVDISSTSNYEILPGEMLIEFKITDGTKVIYPVTAMVAYVFPSIKDDAQITPESYGTTAEILQEVALARDNFNTLGDRLDNIDLKKLTFENLGSTSDTDVFSNNNSPGKLYAVNLSGTSYWFFNTRIGSDANVQCRFSKNGIEIFHTTLNAWLNIGGKGDEVVEARGKYNNIGLRFNAIDGLVPVEKSKFDIGTIGIGATEWSYYSNDYRVRTKPNVTLRFSKGTVLSLSDYTSHKFIISWERTRGVSGDYISSGWLQEDFVCPVDSNYVMIIAGLTDTVEVTDVSQLLSLLTIKSGESEIIRLNSDTSELRKHTVMPSTRRMPTMYLCDGESIPIYANSFVNEVSDWRDAFIAQSMTSGGISDVKYHNNGMIITADISDSYNNPHPAGISFANADKSTVSAGIPVKVVSASTSGTKKVLCIGDSLTYGGKYLAQYRSMYGSDSLNIEFVGTLGQGTDASPYREGRAQWNTKAYCTQSTFANATNAFMNPNTYKFDFSYYCSQNNISPDIVCLFLGTNELTVQVGGSYPTLAESEEYFAEMIASIRQYSATIPIVVWWCPIPCQMNGGGGVTMGKASRMSVGNMLCDNYIAISGTSYVPVDNVYILPVYAVLSDSDYTINDVVLSEAETVKSCADSLHPTDVGHKKIAVLLHGILKYLSE